MIARLIIIAVIVAAMLCAYHAIAKPPPSRAHNLSWDWPGQPVTFLIETKADKQPWKQVGRTTNQTYRYTNLSVYTMTQYYRVRATDGNVTSDYSNIAFTKVRELWLNH